VRADGFHGLATMYQTLGLHDLVTISASRASETRIVLTTNHLRVPVDGRNTAWQMAERALRLMGAAAEVEIHIEKRLPVQGGMGGGSANAAAALIGLEMELEGWESPPARLPGPDRLRLAAEVGSDVPLFLVGGAVLGLGRGEMVLPMPDVTLGDGNGVPCVVAVPTVGVSTPLAFAEWDLRQAEEVSRGEIDQTQGDRTQGDGYGSAAEVGGAALSEPDRRPPLTSTGSSDKLDELSLTYTTAYAISVGVGLEPGASGIVGGQIPEGTSGVDRRGRHGDLAGNTLLALVRTGIENDFEEVVFPFHPSLRETKRLLMGEDSGKPAIYGALSGSGSALFGLYQSAEDARAAQQRVQGSGTEAILTETLTRAEYWARMFADRI